MPDIHHRFPINATPSEVFDAVSTPDGLDRWWTKASSGVAEEGARLALGFGAGYQWTGTVSVYRPGAEFELVIDASDPDWQGTRVGFTLHGREDCTQVEFRHTGWPADNDHYRTSNFCWAMYLRIMKRYLENGDFVEYERRLDD